MKICARCDALAVAIGSQQEDGFVLHPTFRDLQSGSDGGCHFCRIILNDATQKLDGSHKARCSVLITRYNEEALRVKFPIAPTPGVPNATKPGQDAESLGTWIRLGEWNIPTRLQAVLDSRETSGSSLGTTGSDASISLAMAWLSECLAGHRHCGTVSHSPTRLPRRVLDLNAADVASGIRLVETSGQTGSYAALSHCWGGGTPIKTMTENISDHLLGIRESCFPRTFIEAIHLTRKLGIQYLWIDSLCIIQNDVNDWEREADMMHHYYKNSLVTIAAADGKNGDAGLFRERDALAARPCQLRIPDRLGNARVIYAFTPGMSFQRTHSNMPMLYMSNPLPLYTRCWVFQEQVLSPRALTYSRDGFSWRCQEMVFDEKPPLVQSIVDFISDERKTQVRMGKDHRPIDASIAQLQCKWIYPRSSMDPALDGLSFHEPGCMDHSNDFLLAWGKIVQDYTERDLTQKSDTLIAIRGVAQAARAVVGRSYFAGIWVDTPQSIFMGLLWSVSAAHRRDPHRTGVAPSWSWASVSSRVVWPGHWMCRLESRVDIIDLAKSGSPAKAIGELTVNMNVKPAVMENGRVVRLVEWDGFGGEKVDEERMTLDKDKAQVFFDENLEGDGRVWFAELAVGEIHARRHARFFNCTVLLNVSGDPSSNKAKFRRVGYSIWDESTWNDSESLSKRVRVCLI